MITDLKELDEGKPEAPTTEASPEGTEKSARKLAEDDKKLLADNMRPRSEADFGGFSSHAVPLENDRKPPMPESTTPVAMGHYTEPGAAHQNASLMPEPPATMVEGKIISIHVEAVEFADRLGNLDYRITVNATGRKGPVSRSKRRNIALSHFRGYWGSVWQELGAELKVAIEEAMS